MSTAHTDQWRSALDTVLCECIDDVADNLAAACIGVRTSESAVRKLAADLSLGRLPQGTPAVAIPEIFAVLLVDPDPAVVMAARERIRQWYFTAQSGRVADEYWAAQDRAEHPQRDPMDAYKEWAEGYR